MPFHRSKLFLLLIPLLTLLLPAPAAANHTSGSGALCIPSVQQPLQIGCLQAGPNEYLEKMAAEGIQFPLQPIAGVRPNPEMRNVPNLYAQVVSNGALVFGSLDDAVAGENALYRLEAGFDFVSYFERAEVGGRPYYMIDHGVWMRGADLSRISAMPSFQGLEFRRTPSTSFGWVLFETQSRAIPGLGVSPNSLRTFYRYNLVQIYRVERVNGQDWYLIGPDEWLEGRVVAMVTPNPVAPDGVTNGRWVEVNLAEQTIAVYESNRMAFATVISSGLPGTWTQPGLFQAYQKKANETMSGSFTADRSDFYYLEDVPWTIYFDQARALHGTYWHNGFGVPRSRGCVNLSTGDARWIFDWIQEGDWVYVWDPSGETPTDPSLYGAGGA